MYPKQRPPPLEVSYWMEKDLKMRKIAANSRLMTNDMRQNIVLSRQFFSNLLTLSYARYRRLGEHEFNKKTFIKNQLQKTETSMPGLRPYIDKFTHGTNRATPSPHHQRENSFVSSSSPLFFSRSLTKSDLRYDRRPQPSTRQIKTAEEMASRPEIPPIKSSTPATSQRPSTNRQMSRERLNLLALPKGVRPKGAHVHPRRINPTDGTETVEEVLAKVDEASQVTTVPIADVPPEKPKTIMDDNRFQDLMGAFVHVHARDTSKARSFKSIVGGNTSLQDDEGHWKMAHPSVSSRTAEHEHNRQILAGKLHDRVDIFLIDVGA